MQYWVLLLSLLICLACSKEEGLSEEIDTALLPYFERFEAEGTKRARSIDLKAAHIGGVLLTIEEEDVVGRCRYKNGDQQIQVDEFYWYFASELEREFLVFHELGHCFLEREHLDAKQSDGSCLSMMYSGLGACNSNYTMETRAAYLDELFSN